MMVPSDPIEQARSPDSEVQPLSHRLPERIPAAEIKISPDIAEALREAAATRSSSDEGTDDEHAPLIKDLMDDSIDDQSLGQGGGISQSKIDPVNAAIDRFWEIDSALTLQPLHDMGVGGGKLGILTGIDASGADPIAGTLTLVALIAGGLAGLAKYFRSKPEKKVSEILFKEDETEKKEGENQDVKKTNILSSSIIYDRSNSYKPYFVALVKLVSGEHALARVQLTPEMMSHYEAVDDEERENIKKDYSERVVKKIEVKAAFKKVDMSKPLIAPLGKRILTSIQRLGDFLGGLLVSYGIWFAVFEAIISSIAQISPAEIALGPIGVFLIPMLAIVLQLIYKAYTQYKNRNNPLPNAYDHLMLEMLARIKEIKNQSLEIRENLENFKNTKIEKLGESERGALRARIESEKIKLNSKNEPMVAGITESTYLKEMRSAQRGRWGRIILKTLVGAVGGFSLVYSTMAPFINLSSMLGAHVLSATGALIPIVAAFSIALVVGYLSFRAARQGEKNRKQNYKVLETELLNQLKNLEADVSEKRLELQNLKLSSAHAHLLKEKTFGHAFKAFSARMDNIDFVNRLSTVPRSFWGKLRSQIGSILKQGLIFVGGAATGSFLIQMGFGFVGSLAVLGIASNPFSLAGLGILIGFVIAGWAISKMVEYHANKQIKKAEARLDQVSSYLESLKQERKTLVEQIALLKALEVELKATIFITPAVATTPLASSKAAPTPPSPSSTAISLSSTEVSEDRTGEARRLVTPGLRR